MNLLPSKTNDVRALVLIVGFVFALILTGLLFAGGGAWLILKGGARYYFLAGVMLIASGVQLWRGRKSGLHIATALFGLTWVWALYEAGLSAWSLLPRIDVIGLLYLAYWLPPIQAHMAESGRSQKLDAYIRYYFPGAWALVGLVVVTLCVAGFAGAGAKAPLPEVAAKVADAGDWRTVGGTAYGSRFSTLDQITAKNARDLKLLWSYDGPKPDAHIEKPGTAVAEGAPGRKDEATPLQIGDKLFLCTPDNVVLALDAEDGHVRWRHDPKVNSKGVYWQTCRGVTYYQSADAKVCKARILTATTDARLLALDAETGQPCADFGTNGEVSLKDGMGDVPAGYYYSTSPPTMIGGMAVVGAWVTDNRSTNEPSGVVRAYDARTGKLGWAWDMGRPDAPKGLLKPGEVFTRGTPNAWSIFSADEMLGLIYVPTGNATPDYVGSFRKALWEKYSSSVVALDAKTGAVRWAFQTVHHDLWDYDVAPQPVLTDLPINGVTVPILVQATKRGEIFLLDRRTGVPVSEVTEKAVPQTDVPGEWTAKTQPFSTGMPSLGGAPLREKDMWGLSPFDLMACRIQFRTMRYDGPMTPPALRGTIEYPGTGGGVNWSSVSIDDERHVLYSTSTHLAFTVKLEPRKTPDDVGPAGTLPQMGTPYAVALSPFFTRLRIPCQEPPFGRVTAIDLRTKKVLWQRPLGTAENSGPLSFKTHLPLPIGTSPNVGGLIVTRGGVIFVGASTDRHLRAIDARTGKVLWSHLLPEGSQATPMTYRAPKSGRQIVVIVSGGHVDLEKNVATHVVAYALPDKK